MKKLIAIAVIGILGVAACADLITLPSPIPVTVNAVVFDAYRVERAGTNGEVKIYVRYAGPEITTSTNGVVSRTTLVMSIEVDLTEAEVAAYNSITVEQLQAAAYADYLAYRQNAAILKALANL